MATPRHRRQIGAASIERTEVHADFEVEYLSNDGEGYLGFRIRAGDGEVVASGRGFVAPGDYRDQAARVALRRLRGEVAA